MEAFPVEAGWVDNLLRHGGLANSTNKRYLSAFLSFVQWYSVYGFVIMGGLAMEWSNESVWLMWLGWMSQFRAYSTIRSSIFAIKHHFEIRFGFNPFRSMCDGRMVNYTRFHRALRQVKRDSMGRGRPPKFSLTRFVLLALKPKFKFDSYDDLLVWAIITLGVTCLLRWSEVALVDSDYNKLLRFTDFGVGRDGGFLHLRDTKTKLFGDPMTVSFIRDKSETCALGGLESWFVVRPKRSEWFFFCHLDGSAVKATWVQAHLKGKLSSIGCSSDEYVSGISLRKGGALTLALCGVPDRVTQVLGRWRSDAYRVYVDMTKQERAHWQSVVTDRLAEGKPLVNVSASVMEKKKLMC